MQGLSVFFIASVLPKLIKSLGNVYGHFCGSNFCGKDVKDCPAGKGALSPDDARPYDIDGPLFREGTKDLICPRDGLRGCAFVDFVDVVRPSCCQALCCIGLPIAYGPGLCWRAHGPGDDHDQLHLGVHFRFDRQRADGILCEARPRSAHDVRLDLLHVHQPAPRRRWPVANARVWLAGVSFCDKCR